jgi:hypothetical protein
MEGYVNDPAGGANARRKREPRPRFSGWQNGTNKACASLFVSTISLRVEAAELENNLRRAGFERVF